MKSRETSRLTNRDTNMQIISTDIQIINTDMRIKGQTNADKQADRQANKKGKKEINVIL